MDFFPHIFSWCVKTVKLLKHLSGSGNVCRSVSLTVCVGRGVSCRTSWSEDIWTPPAASSASRSPGRCRWTNPTSPSRASSCSWSGSRPAVSFPLPEHRLASAPPGGFLFYLQAAPRATRETPRRSRTSRSQKETSATACPSPSTWCSPDSSPAPPWRPPTSKWVSTTGQSEQPANQNAPPSPPSSIWWFFS